MRRLVSINWQTDVRIAFHWLREALLKPLRPGSRVVVVSSGAALAGSPLSGGYAGAKATQRFITGYAQEEARRAGLDITFTAVLPRITPLTDLGRPAVQAYAARAGAVYLDYHSAMADDRQGLRADLTTDGVHPNEAGYRVMAPLAERAIAQALLQGAPR